MTVVGWRGQEALRMALTGVGDVLGDGDSLVLRLVLAEIVWSRWW